VIACEEGAVGSTVYTVVLTRPSARGRHCHLLRRNIVGPVTRLHYGQERDSVNGSDDGERLLRWKRRRGDERWKALSWGVETRPGATWELEPRLHVSPMLQGGAAVRLQATTRLPPGQSALIV
jgi:hypothetical protein